MGPIRAIPGGEGSTRLQPKGRSKVQSTVSVHSKAERWKAETLLQENFFSFNYSQQEISDEGKTLTVG